MYWKNGDLIMERNTVHKFVNSDGVTLNSNIKDIKTNFKYLGEAMYFKKLEKLLKMFIPKTIEIEKRMAKTELEYEQRVFLQFKQFTAKTNPQEYLANYAKHKRMKMIICNLTKDSFMNIMRSNMHNVIDWDVDMTAKGPNYAVKVEVFRKIR